MKHFFFMLSLFALTTLAEAQSVPTYYCHSMKSGHTYHIYADGLHTVQVMDEKGVLIKEYRNLEKGCITSIKPVSLTTILTKKSGKEIARVESIHGINMLTFKNGKDAALCKNLSNENNDE